MVHPEHKLNGVVEAAISQCLYNETWLTDMAESTTIDQGTETEVFQVLESYVTDELALIRTNPTVYLQGPNGEEHELKVTETDPPDGTLCAHLVGVDLTQVTDEFWVRIVPE